MAWLITVFETHAGDPAAFDDTDAGMYATIVVDPIELCHDKDDAPRPEDWEVGQAGSSRGRGVVLAPGRVPDASRQRDPCADDHPLLPGSQRRSRGLKGPPP